MLHNYFFITLGSTAQVEAVIQKAIKEQPQRLHLNLYGRDCSIPDSIGEISSLEVLTFDNESLQPYGLQKIPESIGILSNLKELMFCGIYYDLEYLPETIGCLTNLEKLQIIDCSTLKELPKSIGHLKKLRWLELYECKFPLCSLTTLPGTIGQLTSLQVLTVSSTAIHALPETICDLSNLEYLTIQGNPNLSYLPSSLGKLQKLIRLSLEYGFLTSLPESVGNLKNLREILANNNRLTHLPESIGDLPSLETLELMQNQLTELPESIGKLSTLRDDIYLFGNPIKRLPDSVSELPVEVAY
jgi:Leucine-rich repeat (LRR) protein